MSGLKEIKTRIQSIGSTIQITSAMKMVSAAKLKKAQNKIIQMRLYESQLQRLVQNICFNLEVDMGNIFIGKREKGVVLLVVITSNKGLCGAFNSSIVKETIRTIDSLGEDRVELLTIGKKGNDVLRGKYSVHANKNELFSDLTFKNSEQISTEIIDWFLEGKYKSVHLIYNHFKNTASQVVINDQYLPIQLPKNKAIANVDYIFEPGKKELVQELIPMVLKLKLYKAIRDSFLAEHGARMIAMHKATDNANSLLSELKLTYNKARQASITNEILEIVSGSEALKG